MTTRRRYLLDTNVISELRRGGAADPRLLSFLTAAGTSHVFLSVLTLGELREGAARQRRRNPVFADRLTAWVETTEQEFADRTLGIDLETARLWGELSATRTRPIIDTLLAATAIVHNLVFVTRNTHDVDDTGAIILNPWTDLS